MLTRDLQALGHNALSLSPASSFGGLPKEYSAPDGLPVTQCPCLFPSLPKEELKVHLGWGYEVVLMTCETRAEASSIVFILSGLEQSQI